MKKLFLIIAVISIYSCQKGVDSLPATDNLDAKAAKYTEYTPNFYDFVMLINDPCDGETIKVTGVMNVYAKASYQNDRYVISWKYSAESLLAVGETSGNAYSITIDEGQTSSGTTYGGSQYTVSVKARVKSPNGSLLIYTYKEHMSLGADGELNVFFTDENYNWNCK